MGEHVTFIGGIDVALDDILTHYTAEAAVAVEKGIDVTGNHLSADSKKNAPVDGGKWKSAGFPPHRAGGTYKRHISKRKRGRGFEHSYMWFVKSPEYRLTHLLANGHQLFIFGRNAHKRTKADPFVHDAYDRACREIAANIRRCLP